MDPSTLIMINNVLSILAGSATKLPSIFDAGRTAIDLLESDRDPTADEAAVIRAALDDSHEALQRA